MNNDRDGIATEFTTPDASLPGSDAVVVVVVGGSGRVGSSMARLLSERGHRVAITTHRRAGPPGMFSVTMDITDQAQVVDAFDEIEERVGPIGAVVHTAVLGVLAPFRFARTDDLQNELSTNVSGAFHVAQDAARRMAKRRRGRIILISSVAARMPQRGLSAYSASKSAVESLVLSAGIELSGTGVTVNGLALGVVESAVPDLAVLKSATTAAEQIIETSVAQRAVSDDDICNAVEFLISDDAGHITGVVIPVDGGFSAHVLRS